MAAGSVTASALSRKLEILSAAIATNSPPSGATAGFDVNQLFSGSPAYGAIFVKSTAGSGTVSVTLRLWSYDNTAAVWTPCGTGTGALKGVLNAGAAIPEDATIGADLIRHYEAVGIPWAFDRIYLEITAISGTSTAITAYLVVPATQGGG